MWGEIIMKVDEIMHKILSAEDNLTLSEISKLMIEKGRGSIILTKDKIPTGIFTERDAVRLMSKDIKNLNELRIKDIMSKPILTVHKDTSVENASKLMVDKRIRRLPVVDDKQELVGIITAASISKNQKFMMAKTKVPGMELLTGYGFA